MVLFSDTQKLAEFKTNTSKILNTKFTTHKLHSVSSYFWSNLLHLRRLSTKIQEEKYNVLNLEDSFIHDEESGRLLVHQETVQGTCE
jgi:hypothetical protein